MLVELLGVMNVPLISLFLLKCRWQLSNISYSDKPHLLVSMQIKQYLAIARPRENVIHR
ncbi:hypothetical protein AAZX31_13G099600 [Glycine max]|nr:hypothetical protein GLYMA_13G117050v4 [Glycine max]KAH1101010.1 hypothetical protein GYH30_035899 [Glycine max]